MWNYGNYGDSILNSRDIWAVSRGEGIKYTVPVIPVLDETRRNRPYKMRRATFKGKGLHADVRGASWERIWELAYGDRGV
jgi:hypothetical protein